MYLLFDLYEECSVVVLKSFHSVLYRNPVTRFQVCNRCMGMYYDVYLSYILSERCSQVP